VKLSRLQRLPMLAFRRRGPEGPVMAMIGRGRVERNAQRLRRLPSWSQTLRGRAGQVWQGGAERWHEK
jgi:hypothetical protein